MKYKSFEATDGHTLTRLSRWIKIRYAYNVKENNSLYYYAEDCGNGDNAVSYFVFKGIKFAINRFISNASAYAFPVMWYQNGKLQHIAGYDSENYYNPIMIELDDGCQYVRVYTYG